ncbi:hypothetical protein DTW90_02575 [Neorhizobium sp. P12A]|uniref:hypothetical protein n=1 Tax=Neorhizobium sp. P12A TaxID=2268027 RepID=UPI0011EC95B9|nr:hypothetical protein [Neorhizobium sp. P12A]KAA0700560.1 hypothetical protein DTW90_02575 [Neorhizobium sp. P12A]
MYPFARFLAVLSLAGAAGCTATIDAQNIKSFGDAAKAVATATQDARTIDNKLVADIATEDQATQFMRGGGPYEFPLEVKPTKATGKVWDVRIAYAKALADYGDALAAAASGVQGDSLDNAVDNLQKAATTALPHLSEAKNFQTVSDASEKVVKTVVTQAALDRIHKAIVRAHPSVVKGREILGSDLAKVAGQVQRHYDEWLTEKKTALDTIQAGSSADEKYQAYRNSLEEQASMENSIGLLVATGGAQQANYITVLDKMVAAHAALAKSTSDSLSLQSFIDATKQLQAFSDALPKGGQS